MLESSARLLALLGLMQSRRDWTGPELAERLGVTDRTVRKDVDRLRLLGYPVDAVRGPHGHYRLGVGASLPPLLLDEDEAVAVAVGLRAADRDHRHRGDQRAGARQARLRAPAPPAAPGVGDARGRAQGPENTGSNVDGSGRRRGAATAWPRRSATTRRSGSTIATTPARRSSPTGWCRGSGAGTSWPATRIPTRWAPYRVDWLTLKTPGGRRFRPVPFPGGLHLLRPARGRCRRVGGALPGPRRRAGRGGARPDQPDGRRRRGGRRAATATSSPAATASRSSRCGSACSASTSTSRSRRPWSRRCGFKPEGMRRRSQLTPEGRGLIRATTLRPLGLWRARRGRRPVPRQ